MRSDESVRREDAEKGALSEEWLGVRSLNFFPAEEISGERLLQTCKEGRSPVRGLLILQLYAAERESEREIVDVE